MSSLNGEPEKCSLFSDTVYVYHSKVAFSDPYNAGSTILFVDSSEIDLNAARPYM